MVNRLQNEASPYLKMHADNPVDWYPWGEEALQKAKDENKPILLSIGYTACHWCHVMAHESFEDNTTADLMNLYFVNIKIDREERPDLDKIYQLSAQLLTQKVGGWPLTVFLMPQTQIPFFAGTYFPNVRRGNFPTFQEVLQYVHDIYTHKQEELQKQNSSFQNIIKELENQAQEKATDLSPAPIDDGQALLKRSFDKENGGFGSAPKFPMSSALERLLLYGDQDSLDKLKFSLKTMTSRGLYDHIGGGFFRYTVDQNWQIPHFEKMLYDNALLLSLLVETQMIVGHDITLSESITGTADWLLREMTAEEGGFYATLSADTEGKEGKYYIWKRDEIKTILSPEEYEVAELYYGLNQSSNFNHHWHLNIANPLDQVATQLKLDQNQVGELLIGANKKLFQARQARVYPQRDEKIIVAWNGLAIKAFALAGLHFGKSEYIAAAQKAADFIRTTLWKDGELNSVYKDGQITTTANLDDYVFLIEGLFYLLQTKWREQDYQFLMDLLATCQKQFEDHQSGGFYFTAHSHEQLIYRMKQYADESIPSSNAVFSRVLQQIGYLVANMELLGCAENGLKNAFPHVLKHPDFYCSFLTSLQFYYHPSKIIIVRNKENDRAKWQRVFLENYLPNSFIFFLDQDQSLPDFLDIKKSIDNKTTAYICDGTQCYEPITNLEEFASELRRIKTSSG